jgi:RimJ/RimL family protein N-acetyltransferase
VSFYVKKISSEDWQLMSESAHVIAFGEKRESKMDRVDFGLIAIDNKGEVSGYVTCIEMDQETIYWQHGGAMPEYKGSIHTIQGYTLFVNWCHEHYRRITTKIENTNTAMLKLAMKLGFTITGTEVFKGKLLVQMIRGDA